MAFRVQLNFPRFPQLLAGLNNDFRVGHDVGNPQKCKLMQANTNMGSSLDTANLYIIKIEKCVLLKLDYKLNNWNQCVNSQRFWIYIPPSKRFKGFADCRWQCQTVTIFTTFFHAYLVKIWISTKNIVFWGKIAGI